MRKQRRPARKSGVCQMQHVDHVDTNFKPFDLPAVHIFKIRDGKIHEIEAMGFLIPYNSKTGWE